MIDGASSFRFSVAVWPLAVRERSSRIGCGPSENDVRFGLRQRNFHAVHVEGFVEPFQCDAPNALQAQPFAGAQLRNRVGD